MGFNWLNMLVGNRSYSLIALSNNSDLIATTNNKNKVNVWQIQNNNAHNYRAKHNIRWLFQDDVREYYIDDNSSLGGYIDDMKNEITIIEKLSNKISINIKSQVFEKNSICETCYLVVQSVSSDKKIIAVMFYDFHDVNNDNALSKIVYIWDLYTNNLITKVSHDDMVFYAIFNSNHTQLATITMSSTNNIVYLRSIMKKKHDLKLEHPQEIEYIAFVPNRDQLITASIDKVVRVWDTTTGNKIFQIKNCRFFKLSHNGRILLAFSDQNIHVINSETWRLVVTIPLKINANSINDHLKMVLIKLVQFNHNDTRLAVISKENIITILDTRTWLVIREIPFT